MKAVLFTLLILLCYHIAQAQPAKKTDWDYDDLKGRARLEVARRHTVLDTLGKVEMTLYFVSTTTYDTNGNRIYQKNVNEVPEYKNMDDSTAYTYDRHGDLIREEEYDSYGRLNKRITTEYDSLRRSIKETELEYEKDDSGVVLDSFITIDTYVYNQLNKIHEIYRVELVDSVHFSLPRLYVSNVYRDSGRVRYQYEYRDVHDPRRVDTSYLRMNAGGQDVEQWNKQTHSCYTYYDSGKFRTATYVGRPHERSTTTTYQYDKWGNRTNERSLDCAGNQVGDAYATQYLDIDEHGNWRKTRAYRNGRFVYSCTRDMEYY